MIVLSRPTVDYKTAFATRNKDIYKTGGLYFYPRGRDALVDGLRALGVRPSHTILVPAYVCDSMVAHLRKAGYQIVFIDIERDLNMAVPKVLAAVNDHDVRAVLVIHYFGICANVSELTSFLRPLGVFVIEDCCHSFLSNVNGKPIGLIGDAAIFSMRKTLPVPDGGALRLNFSGIDRSLLSPPRAGPSVMRYVAARELERMVAMIGLPNIYSDAISSVKKHVRGTAANEHLPSVDSETRMQEPSCLLAGYLSNVDYLRAVSDSVVANYAYLVERAQALGLRPYMPKLPVGCVPQWAMFEDPSGSLVQLLRKRGVGACHWPWAEIPTEVSENRYCYPISNELNSKITLVPTHQSITRKQADWMLHTISMSSTVSEPNFK